jgi:hypothetical protein
MHFQFAKLGLANGLQFAIITPTCIYNLQKLVCYAWGGPNCVIGVGFQFNCCSVQFDEVWMGSNFIVTICEKILVIIVKKMAYWVLKIRVG